MTPIRERRRRFWVAAPPLLALAGVGTWYALAGTEESAAVPLAETFAARRGPLTIAVREAGTIRARDQLVLKSEVEGQTTILSLVEEGKHVEEGDLLVRLDARS